MTYSIKHPDLAGKLSPRQALIQAGLDSGWGALLGNGDKPLNKLNKHEGDYLKGAAVSYFLAGDPVIKFRVLYYCRAEA